MDRPDRIKTRILLLSDTHSALPKPAQETSYPYRWPLPQADIAIHTGDLTSTGKLHEHERALDLLTNLRADLKIVIPGNHDLTLDTAYYAAHGHLHGPRPKYTATQLQAVRDLYTGPAARAANILYVEEGVRTVRLRNGAALTVYASAYTPEFCGWAFAYPREQDRYNDPVKAEHPVPSFDEHHENALAPNIDVMLTHGPPWGVLDRVRRDGTSVGCEHLLEASARARPLVHCFGHIHEGWGAVRKTWSQGVGGRETQMGAAGPLSSPPSLERSRAVVGEERVVTDQARIKADMGAYVDATDVLRGSETLFVNSSIMSVRYVPDQAPWVVDLMLDKAV